MFRCGDLDALIDKPVPLIIRDQILCVGGRIGQSLPYIVDVEVVDVDLGGAVAVFAIHVADVEKKIAGKLGFVADQPLLDVALVAAAVEDVGRGGGAGRCSEDGVEVAI